MSNSPLFSVIVPVYGVELYIRQCADSILAQSYADFELILVDDGSKDNCPAICDEYALKDSRVRVIHKANGGLVSARIAGLAAAHGRYVVCIDGDDFVGYDYLKVFADCIAETGADIVCQGSVWWTSEDDYIGHQECVPCGVYDKDGLERVFYHWIIEDNKSRYVNNNLWARTFRTELYKTEQLSVNPSISIGEDGACVKPCFIKADKVAVVGDCLYYYRQNPTSLTKNRKPFDWNGPELIACHLESTLGSLIKDDDNDLQTQIYRNCVHNMFNVAVSRFYQKDKSVSQIKKEIRSNIARPYYYKALKNARFRFLSKGWIAQLVLRLRLMELIRFMSIRKLG